MAQPHPFKGIQHVIIDIDHVINHYNQIYADKFSIATAACFTAVHPQFRSTQTHFASVELAKKSYRETGRTTALFARQFGIDEMQLYKHHHDYMAKDGGFIEQQFANGSVRRNDGLPQLLQSLQDAGIKLYALTNGTENYARMVLGDRGHRIAQYFTDIAGIDSVDNPNLNDKRHGAFISDILVRFKLKKDIDTIEKNEIVMDYSNIALIDDSDANHRAPRFLFNMVTILPLNNFAKVGAFRAQFLALDLPEILNEIFIHNVKPKKSRRLSF